MRLLDLFCGAGGAAVGYSRAGFTEIVGVDCVKQPRYPFTFVRGDALKYLAAHGREFDAIHASPPCQRYTPLAKMWNAQAHPDSVPPTRATLQAVGRPWVMENVPGAPMRCAVMLCGTMFGLGTAVAELRRHRLFELSDAFALAPSCQHGWKAQTIAVYGHAGGHSTRTRERLVIGVYGGGQQRGGKQNRATLRQLRASPQMFNTAARREAMGIDWMTGNELSQAIPPAYTEWVGARLMEAMCSAR